MPRRNIVLTTNETYHVFNRSIARENIFSSNVNLKRIFETLDYYRFPQRLRLSKSKSLPKELREDYFRAFKEKPPLVEIYSFAFMPNHYHFLLRQLQDNGILKFVANLQNSFAKAFNLLSQRDGALFQNSFKAKRVETEEQFTHLSRYIHLNPVTSYLIEFEGLKNYPWTSFPLYAEVEKDSFVTTGPLLKFFGTTESYLKFIADQVDYQRNLASLRDLILE